MNQEKANDGQSFLTPHVLLLASLYLTVLPLILNPVSGLWIMVVYWLKGRKREECEREREKVAAGLLPGFVPVDI